MTPPTQNEQYQTDENLRIRIETHQRYTVGPPIEPAIDHALSLNPDESLLDIGTGPGAFPHRLRRAGHRGTLVGIDSSAGMIAKARSIPANIQFLQADAQSLPFPNHFFNVVTARHMLYHVQNIPKSLQEIHRVLKPGGRFLAITNSTDNMREYRQALSQATEHLKNQIPDILQILNPISDTFNEINGPQFIKNIFGNGSVSFVEAALRFDSADPPLRYFDSCRTFRNFNINEWSIAKQKFAEVINQKLRTGPWFISKKTALLIAQRK